MPVIFSTCWYLFKAKFDSSIYKEWIDNMLCNVNNYYLVIYTDELSKSFIISYDSNPRIKIIIKPIERFYNYKYREQWINNHMINYSLNNRVDWRVNMLWSEKIYFVEETIKEQYFIKEPNFTNDIMYGWCDIGYFRGRIDDMTVNELKMWPNNEKIDVVDKTKIHYGCVNNNNDYINYIFRMVNNKNENMLPMKELPPNLNIIAGGFFILHNTKMEWWKNLYDYKLKTYFDNGYLVKDDQTIITDCIFSNMSNFVLHKEDSHKYDSWFLFQRLLL